MAGNTDLTLYEQNSTLMYLARSNRYDDLKKLLIKNPYNLNDGQEINITVALIEKHFNAGQAGINTQQEITTTATTSYGNFIYSMPTSPMAGENDLSIQSPLITRKRKKPLTPSGKNSTVLCLSDIGEQTNNVKNFKKKFFRTFYILITLVCSMYLLLFFWYFKSCTSNQLESMIYILIGYGISLICVLYAFHSDDKKNSISQINSQCDIHKRAVPGGDIAFNMVYAEMKIWQLYSFRNVFGFGIKGRQDQTRLGYCISKLWKPLSFVLVIIGDLFFCGIAICLMDLQPGDVQCIIIISVCGFLYDFCSIGLLYSFLYRLDVLLGVIGAGYGIRNKFSTRVKKIDTDSKYMLLSEDGFFSILISHYNHGLKVFSVIIANGLIHTSWMAGLGLYIHFKRVPSKSLVAAFIFIVYKTLIFCVMSIFGVNASYQQLNIFAGGLARNSNTTSKCKKRIKKFPKAVSICCMNGGIECAIVSSLNAVEVVSAIGFVVYVHDKLAPHFGSWCF